ncbi:MAG: lamin tail domain-containing protein, partial [Patescibacteria group bacterium]
AQANDEWIELYNASSTPVDLTGWTLINNDNGKDKIRITFATGSAIAAHGFYLLERTADTTIANIKADVIYTGSLKNSGEKLELRHRGGQLIDVVDFARGWPAGSTGQDPISMERISPTASGNVAANWQNTPTLVRNGYDAKGNSIYGTPKHLGSSFNYLNGIMSANRSLSADYNPYFLGALTVASGTVLTVQEGVVMLGGSGGRVNVYGELKTQGTTEKPVVVTSLNDVNYKGDAVVSAAHWEYIKFFNGAKGDFKNTKLLYGNNASQGISVSGGILQADGATVVAEGLEIGQSNLVNDYRLATLINSTTTLSGSKFYQGSAGMYLKGGAVIIKNSQFEDLGLWALEADSLNSLVLENNTFKNNGWVYPTRPFWQQPSSLPAPAAVKNFIPQAKNNVFDNNIINAMSVTGQINNLGVIDNAGDWPWVSGGLTVTASGTLEIKAGSKLKMLAGSTITVNGALNVLGVDGQPVSITSYHDDSDGTDVDLLNNQPAGKEGGEWRQIIFESVATSTLSYLNVSFANGTPRDTNSAGSIFINNTPLLLNNLTVRYSRPSSVALQLKNTNTIITGGLIKNETKILFDPSSASYGVGILIDGGAPNLSSLIIDTFTYGIIRKNNPKETRDGINFINVDKQIMAW